MNGYALDDGDPVEPANFDAALAHVHQSLDLAAVLRRYGVELVERNDGACKATCVLPSLVSGYAGTCAEQDGGKSSVKVYETDVAGYWRWHCYSCKRGGDVVDFIAHREGWPLNDRRNTSLKALRRASSWAGCAYLLDGRARVPGIDEPMADLVTDVDVAATPRPQPRAVEIGLAHALNYSAARHYIAALAKADDARNYLRARGVTNEQITRWGIGYAPEPFKERWSQAIPKAQHKDAARVGLLWPSTTGQHVDVYIGRVVIPYLVPAANADGFLATGFAGRNFVGVDPATGKDVVGFTGYYRGEPPPKWRHSSNIPGVWEKGAALLGLWQAAEQARALGRLTICEGAFDALALERVGVPAVALVGASVTDKHADVIRRLGVRRVTIAVDGDHTGRGAVVGAVSALVKQGFALDCIDVVDCDDGEDPATTDPATLRARWDVPTLAADYLRALGHAPPNVPEEKVLAMRRCSDLVEDLNNHIRSAAWTTAAEFRVYHAHEESLRSQIAQLKRAGGAS